MGRERHPRAPIPATHGGPPSAPTDGRIGQPKAAQNRHLWVLIKAPDGWWVWAPQKRFLFDALSALWAPIPTTHGGGSRPLAGGGYGCPGGSFCLLSWALLRCPIFTHLLCGSPPSPACLSTILRWGVRRPVRTQNTWTPQACPQCPGGIGGHPLAYVPR